ncbi:hypothetical protein GCM10023175_53200 [Pseudonocardia xishanensis]|uniref:Uncharacterized protein n=1 Tax=Pseudonocardia xishanensis TaxID=630995 RepID=A0ABP8RZ45_9PSEU
MGWVCQMESPPSAGSATPVMGGLVRSEDDDCGSHLGRLAVSAEWTARDEVGPFGPLLLGARKGDHPG